MIIFHGGVSLLTGLAQYCYTKISSTKILQSEINANYGIIYDFYAASLKSLKSLKYPTEVIYACTPGHDHISCTSHSSLISLYTTSPVAIYFSAVMRQL